MTVTTLALMDVEVGGERRRCLLPPWSLQWTPLMGWDLKGDSTQDQNRASTELKFHHTMLTYISLFTLLAETKCLVESPSDAASSHDTTITVILAIDRLLNQWFESLTQNLIPLTGIAEET